MVHPTDECSQVTEHSLDLRRQFKLPLAMNVCSVLDRPPRIDTVVDSSAIGLQGAPWFHELVHKLTGIRFPDALPGKDAKGNLRGADLLGHDQCDALEVRLVHLHRPSQYRFQLRQVYPKLPKPVVHRLLIHVAQFLGLEHRYPLRPAPQQCPEGTKVKTHVLEPRVREQREVPPTPWTPVPLLLSPDMTRPALRTEHVLAEDDVPEPLADLGFGGDLLERGDHEERG